MTTDKNKVSELLVSNLIWQMRDAHGRAPVVLDKQLAQAQGAAEDMEAELSRLRQERDELLGALRKCYVQMRFHFREHAELLPVGHYNSADYDATFSAEQCAQRVLAKHKPE